MRGRCEVPGATGGVQHGEHREDEQCADPRRDEVHVARLADRLVPVLRRDAEERGERHRLPPHKKEHCIAGDEDERDPGRQEPVKKAQLAAVVVVIALGPVLKSVNRSERSDDEERNQEQRGERIHANRELASGYRPGARDRDSLAKGTEGDHQPEDRSDHHEQRRHSLAHGRSASAK